MPLNDPIIQNPDEILEQQAISAPAPTATTTATPAPPVAPAPMQPASSNQTSISLPTVPPGHIAAQGGGRYIFFQEDTPEREILRFLAINYPEEYSEYDSTGRLIPDKWNYEGEATNQPKDLDARFYTSKSDGTEVFATNNYAITDPELINLFKSGRLRAPKNRVDLAALQIGANNPFGFGIYNSIASVPIVGGALDEILALPTLFDPDIPYSQATRMLRLASDASKAKDPNLANVTGILGFGLGMYGEGVVLGGALAAKGGTTIQKTLSGAWRGGVYGSLAGGAEGFLRTAGNVDMRVSEAIASATGSGVGGMAFGALLPPGLGVGKSVVQFFRGSSDERIAQQLGVEVEVVAGLGDAIRGKQWEVVERELANIAGDTPLYQLSDGFHALFRRAILGGFDAPQIYKDVLIERSNKSIAQGMFKINSLFGRPPKSVNISVQNLMQQTRSARQSLYNDSYNFEIDYSSLSGSEIRGVLSRIVDPETWVEARKLVQENPDVLLRLGNFDETTRAAISVLPENAKLDYIKRMVPNYADLVPDFNSANTTPSMMELDFLKRALDDQVASLRAAGNTTAANSRARVASDLGRILKQANPKYAEATQFAGGVIGSRDAAEIGSRVLDLNLSQFQDELAQIRKYAEENKIPIGANGFMGDEQWDFFRLGIRSQIDNLLSAAAMIDTGSSTAVNELINLHSLFHSNQNKQKIALLFDAAQADELYRLVDQAFEDSVVSMFVKDVAQKNYGAVKRMDVRLGQSQATADDMQALFTQLTTYMGASQQYSMAAILRSLLSSNSEPANLLRQQQSYDAIADLLSETMERGDFPEKGKRTGTEVIRLLRRRQERDEPLNRPQVEAVTNYLIKYILPSNVHEFVEDEYE